MIWDSNLCMVNISSLLLNIQTGFGAQSASYSMGTGALSLGGKASQP